jgi:hypothetical protein
MNMRNLGIALCEMALVAAVSRAEKKLSGKIWNTALDEIENTKFSDEEVRRVTRVMGGFR